MHVKDDTKSTNKGVFSKGHERADTILDAAGEILIAEGYQGLSMRHVAQHANLTLGHLQYYFPSKNHLLKALLEKMANDYYQEFSVVVNTVEGSSKARLTALLSHQIRQLNDRNTSRFFLEMWELSNHYEHAAELMHEKYAQSRKIIAEYIRDINPLLNGSQVNKLTLYISASVEGLTPFIGHDRPLVGETENMIKLYVQSILWLIENGEVPS